MALCNTFHLRPFSRRSRGLSLAFQPCTELCHFDIRDRQSTSVLNFAADLPSSRHSPGGVCFCIFFFFLHLLPRRNSHPLSCFHRPSEGIPSPDFSSPFLHFLQQELCQRKTKHVSGTNELGDNLSPPICSHFYLAFLLPHLVDFKL